MTVKLIVKDLDHREIPARMNPAFRGYPEEFLPLGRRPLLALINLRFMNTALRKGYTQFELLKSILSQPAAPFREKLVRDLLRTELDKHSVPHFLDPIGNIVVGASSKKDYLSLLSQRSKEPLRIFIAHMDHPGFHGESWQDDTHLEFKWHGGSPTRELEGAKVWLATAEGRICDGTLKSASLLESGRAISHGVIELLDPSYRSRFKSPQAIFGGFHFREFYWQEDSLIYTKAADDLVGVFAITALAIGHFKKSSKKSKQPPFLGLLTRAEEVGFIGAIGHFELGWLKKAKRPILGISLETSRALPGAEIGKGPVVRLGDRSTIFDSGALQVLTELAQKVLPNAHQRRIMDGGSCEASAATAYQIPCIGISVPLGNYHNQCFEGGPDSRGQLGPAPEFVHLEDVRGLQTLCNALLQPNLAWHKPWEKRKSGFKMELKRYTRLLREGKN